MDLRRCARIFWLVNFYGLTPLIASAELYPGQSPAKGYIEFSNGARGVVTGYGSNHFNVEYWLDGMKRNAYYDRAGNAYSTLADIADNPSNYKHLNPSKLMGVVRVLGALGSTTSSALAVLLTPSDLASGEMCGTLSGRAADVCNSTGIEGCESQAIQTSSSTWGLRGMLCLARTYNLAANPLSADTTFFLWASEKNWDGLAVQNSSGNTVLDLADYPNRDYEKKHVIYAHEVHWSHFDDMPPVWSQCMQADPSTCVIAEPVHPDVIEEASEIIPPVPAADQTLPIDDQPEITVMPDIWEPFEMPPGVDPARPAPDMNPGGDPSTLPALPGTIAQPQPWPHGTEVVGGDPATDGDQRIEVTFPDSMDVRVTNFPDVPSVPVEPAELPERVLDLAMPSLESDWVGASCPAPESIQFYEAELPLDWQPACDLAVRISGFLVMLSLLAGLRLAWGAIS